MHARTANEDVVKMFKRDTPVGPLSTPVGKLTRARRYHDLLFDHDNTLSRKSSNVRPSLLIGRRGSGKTAFLYHLCFDEKYTHRIVIDSAQAFEEITIKLRRLLNGDVDPYGFVENVAKLWRLVLLTPVLSTIHQKHGSTRPHRDDPDLQAVGRFLAAAGMSRVTSPRTVVNSIMKLAREAEHGRFAALADFLDDLFTGEADFEEAVEAFSAFCDRHSISTIVLIDSMEQFPIHNKDANFTLSGLLHMLGRLRLEFLPVDFCFCLPSELYAHFLEQSTNPEKDFESRLILYWRSHEILKLCARRFDYFLNGGGEPRIGKPRRLSAHPRKAEVVSFWLNFFPQQIRNRKDQVEDTLPYILRHTQLLPRHLICILNEIIRLALSKDEDKILIDEDDIRRGVRLAEESICEGIINSYSQPHVGLRQLCERIIPHLPTTFSLSDFQVRYNHHARGAAANYHEALRILKEIGAVGIILRETDRYFVAEFEYTTPGTLNHSDFDRFALHPVFSGQFRAGMSSPEWHQQKAVYPLGTDIEGDDDRL